jgi:NADPH-dependent 2,4-dienoyl-CoA reductase/sulfur reductase-like enzyme
MTANQTILIAGASLAGAKAAETLRDEGFDGRIVLAGAEPEDLASTTVAGEPAATEEGR